MMTKLCALAAVAALSATPVLAQDEAPPYENGPVWTFTQIKTKDGRSDEYMRWLATGWKSQEEALKHDGVILDYKVYAVDNPRPGEGDLILAQEWRNMAQFDTPVAQIYAANAKRFGSVVKQDKEEADRGAMREVMGSMMAREIRLK